MDNPDAIDSIASIPIEMDSPLSFLKRVIRGRINARDLLKSRQWKTIQDGFGKGSLATREFYPRLAQILQDKHWCYARENFIGGGAFSTQLAFMAIHTLTGDIALIACESTMMGLRDAIGQVNGYFDFLGIQSAKKIIAVPELPKSPASPTYQSERDALRDANDLLLTNNIELILIPRQHPKRNEWHTKEESLLWYVSWHGSLINGFCLKCEYGAWRFKTNKPYSAAICSLCGREIESAVGTRTWSKGLRSISRRCKKANSAHSYVYLMQDADGLYKIGCSKNPSRRLKQLSSADNPVTLLCTIANPGSSFRIERDLHWLFSAKRVKGEWFKLSEEDVRYIKFLAGSRRSLHSRDI